MYERVLTFIHIRSSITYKQRMDPEVISAVASLYFDRDDAKVTKGINLQVFFETLQKRDPFLGGWLGWYRCPSHSGSSSRSSSPPSFTHLNK